MESEESLFDLPRERKQWGAYVEYDQMPKEFQLMLKRREAKWPIQNFEYATYVFTEHKLGKNNSGALLDGKEYKQFPVPA